MKIQNEKYLDLFNRQRRNLMVTSLLLFFVAFYEMEYPEMNFLGNKFKFAEPVGVGNILVYFLGYFLLRYYQFFRDLGDKGIRVEFDDRSRRIAASKSLKRFNEIFKHETKIENAHANFNDRNPWTFAIQYTNEIEGSVHAFTEKITLGKSDQILISGQASWQIILHTPSITEFFLPFLMGISAFGYYIYKEFGFLLTSPPTI